MVKKHKQPQPNNREAEDSSIFKTLFGNETLDDQSSIFSSSNPFRRKPTVNNPPNPQTHEETPELGSGLGLGLGLEAEDGDSLSKRKRKKEKSKNLELDSDEEVPLEGKKSKLGGAQEDPSVDINENPDLGDMVKKEKKKRKRNEIEAEYEERRYGPPKDESGGEVVVGEKRKKLDNGEDMHISKDGFDDEEKLLRTVFVGNLPMKIKKKALLREFSQFGEVESVRIRSIPLLDDKIPRKGAIMKKQINDAVGRVNAYIVFKAEESAQASLSHNMAVVGGNHIHVDRACPPRKKLKGDNSPLYDNKRTVFVGNLPFDVKDEEIYQLFSGIGNLKTSIEAIRVVRDPGTSMGKGIAYVLFKTRDAANMVVRKYNFLKIRDRDLRLSHAAASTSTPCKRKNSFKPEKYSSPTKKFGSSSLAPDSSNKKTASYQGMRASKIGVQKKVAFKKRTSNQGNSESTQKAPKHKLRTGKRPAVAARRAAANGLPSGGGSDQAGKKRKAGSRTPQSNNKNKKARRFK